MNIVCDTNVLVSGALFGGHAREILRLAGEGAIRNHVSRAILGELEEVLTRPKFGLAPERVAGILQELQDVFEMAVPIVRIAAVSADPDDDRILEAALAAKADCIVSGDKHLLSLGKWRGMRILSPAGFMAEFAGR